MPLLIIIQLNIGVSLAKLDILLNSEPVDALSALVHKSNSYTLGKKLCSKLKELIPRQQFDIAIQSAIGSKIVSRAVKALKKMLLQSVTVVILLEKNY